MGISIDGVEKIGRAGADTFIANRVGALEIDMTSRQVDSRAGVLKSIL